MTPLVSIVMPSFNQRIFLGEAIESVLSQDYACLELIVADGGSTDGSVQILADFASQDARITWVSEPDSGPADAVNKALSKARGTLIGWLNSDDLYMPGAISRAVHAFEANPHWVMLYGEGQHIDGEGHHLERYPAVPPSDHALEDFEAGCFVCQPTVFFKRTLKLLLGDLDIGYKTTFDFDYWLRAFKRFPGRIGYIDAPQAKSRLHVACITRTQRRRVAIENMQVILRHLGDPQPHWLLSYAREQRAENPGLPLETLRTDLYAMINELTQSPSGQGLATLTKAIQSYQ